MRLLAHDGVAGFLVEAHRAEGGADDHALRSLAAQRRLRPGEQHPADAASLMGRIDVQPLNRAVFPAAEGDDLVAPVCDLEDLAAAGGRQVTFGREPGCPARPLLAGVGPVGRLHDRPPVDGDEGPGIVRLKGPERRARPHRL